MFFCCRCDGKRSCDIDVNSGVFGDPCPNTHKYVEVHYACSQVGSPGSDPSGDSSTRKLPPWLLETGTHLWNTDPANAGLVDPNTGIPIQIVEAVDEEHEEEVRRTLTFPNF